MAMVKAISEQSPTFGGYVHFGATSQDINDTVLALQMTECKARAVTRTRTLFPDNQTLIARVQRAPRAARPPQATLLEATRSVRRELTRLAAAHRDVVSIGRTHGQHAIPITMGFKFANFLYEFSVAERFLERVEVRP